MRRVLPAISPLTKPFWQSGADGRLRLQRCAGCGRFQHPPRPICAVCLSRELRWQVVSGQGRIESFTVNHQPWRPDLKEPYIIAVVSLVEQSDLRLTTKIVGCTLESVHIGQAVRVRFDMCEDVHLPLFEPTFAE